MAPAATTLHDVPDKLLHLILSCLMASPLCLARAAVTCKRWRRIVGHNGFFSSVINRSTRIHPHPVAGHYHSTSSRPNGRDNISFVPSSPPALRIDSRHFSLDFLPGGLTPWEIVDSNSSLLLLAKRKKSGWMRRCFPDLLVCEPVTRRYQLIPRMEEMKRRRCLGVFVYGGATTVCSERGRFAEWAIIDSMSTFSVTCVVYEELIGVSDGVGTLRSCTFSGRNRMWYVEKSRVPTVHLRRAESLRFLGRASYRPFWSIEGDNKRLLAGTYFELRWLPDQFQGTVLRVFGDGWSIRMVCLQGSSLQIFVTPADRNDEWVLERSLELMEATRRLAGHKEEYFDGGPLSCVKADEGSVVLAPSEGTWQFAVDFSSMEVAEYNHRINGQTSS